MSTIKIVRELGKRVYSEQIILFYSCSEIAKMIDCSKSQAYVEIKKLVKEGILVENPLTFGRQAYQLNREYYNKYIGKQNGIYIQEETTKNLTEEI